MIQHSLVFSSTVTHTNGWIAMLVIFVHIIFTPLNLKCWKWDARHIVCFRNYSQYCPLYILQIAGVTSA